MFEKLKEHWWSILTWWLLWIIVLWLSYWILHYNLIISLFQNDKALIPWEKDWYTITTHVWEQLEEKVKETEDILLEKQISNWKEKFSWKIKIIWNDTTELTDINNVWIDCDTWFKEESWNCILQNDKATIPRTKDWYTIITHVWEQLEKNVKEAEDILLKKQISNWKQKFSWTIKITWNNTTELININSIWIKCDTWFIKESWNCVIDKCPNPIYLDSNWVTVKAKDCAEAWKTYKWNWNTWYVARDKDDVLRKIFRDKEDKEWNWTFRANRVITSKLTNMNEMFVGKKTFNQDISNWDTSNVGDMESMFLLVTSFNQNINYWNTSNVTNMIGMFCWATLFNQPIWNWNTSKVTKMKWMFFWALSFNQPIWNWNTSNVTNMEYMFADAKSFNQNIDNWNTSNVISIKGIFSWETLFNPDIFLKWNLNKVNLD